MLLEITVKLRRGHFANHAGHGLAEGEIIHRLIKIHSIACLTESDAPPCLING
jgi:hypothetical protein